MKLKRQFCFVLTVLLVICSVSGSALGEMWQQPTGKDNIIYTLSSDVGIGLDNPTRKLHVIAPEMGDAPFFGNGTSWMQFFIGTLGDNSWNALSKAGDSGIIFSDRDKGSGNLIIAPWAEGERGIKILNNGNVGIGTSTPESSLHIVGKLKIKPSPGDNDLIYLDTERDWKFHTGGSASETFLGLQALVGWKKFIVENLNGGPVATFFAATKADGSDNRVGIGTAFPEYTLDVNGTIKANEIVVNTTGADYVFEENYKLKPLREVESFIEKEKHLPDIPSAAEMQTEGVGISDMQTKLLAKVEELTLYLIEQNKNMTIQNKKIEQLIAENETLKKKVAALEQ